MKQIFLLRIDLDHNSQKQIPLILWDVFACTPYPARVSQCKIAWLLNGDWADCDNEDHCSLSSKTRRFTQLTRSRIRQNQNYILTKHCISSSGDGMLDDNHWYSKLTAMFLARFSAFFLAARAFSRMRFSMMASSSLVKGRKVGRLASLSLSDWLSDILIRTPETEHNAVHSNSRRNGWGKV